MLSDAMRNATIDEYTPAHPENVLPDTSCKTIPLVDNFSTCLTHNLECKYISPFGYSYLCMHPRHREFSR